MTTSDDMLAPLPRPPLPEAAERVHKLSVDELLAARVTPQPGVGSVSLADMERAIAEGASGLRR